MSLEKAFHLTANADAYVPRPATESCAEALDAWAGGAGARVAVLWGPSGIGKTLMMRMLQRRLEGHARTVYVPNPIFGPAEMSLWALDSLGIEPDEDRQASLLRAADELRRNGSDVVLLIDDVELLPTATEEWLLTKAGNHLSILMAVTDPGRRDRLMEAADGGASLVALATPMTADETAVFVREQLVRLDVPPAVMARFDHDTLTALHERCEGLPVHVQNEASMLLREAIDAARPPRAHSRTPGSLGSQIVSIGQEGTAPVEAAAPAPAIDAARFMREFVRTPPVALGLAFLAGFALAAGLAALRDDRPAAQQAGSPPEASTPAVSSAPPADLATGAAAAIAEVKPPSEPVSRATPTTATPEPALSASAPAARSPARATSAPAARNPARATSAPAAQNPAPAATAAVARESTPEPGRASALRSTILVAINARPWGNVRIDGEDMGETPMAEVPLDAGKHRFEVRLADGRLIARDIEISQQNRHLSFE